MGSSPRSTDTPSRTVKISSCWRKEDLSILAVPWVILLSLCPPPSPTRFSPRSNCGPTPLPIPLESTCCQRNLTRRSQLPTSVPSTLRWPSYPENSQTTLESLWKDLISPTTTDTSLSCSFPTFLSIPGDILTNCY